MDVFIFNMFKVYIAVSLLPFLVTSSAFLSQPCTSDVQELIKQDPCPTDGGWAPWGSWGLCSTTCGLGLARRSRACINPAPSILGRQCIGDTTDFQLCQNAHACPVDGFWSEWSAWFCGFVILRRARQRTCLGPLLGGEGCVGNETEIHHDEKCTV